MALQDNFNAIYNKKEQQKAEKLKIKIHDENIEQQLLEDLQALQLDYITENEKNLLLLPKTKNNLINEVVKNNKTKILKNSKYINTDYQKTYLLKKYDTITNKTLRLAKIFDKIQEEKEAEQLKEKYKNTQIIEISEKKQKQKQPFNWSKFWEVCGYIAIIPLLVVWGLIEGIMKNKK